MMRRGERDRDTDSDLEEDPDPGGEVAQIIGESQTERQGQRNEHHRMCARHGTGNRREHGRAAEVGHWAPMHLERPGAIHQPRAGSDRRRDRSSNDRDEQTDDQGHIKTSWRTPR